jgi:hypothetical protein
LDLSLAEAPNSPLLVNSRLKQDEIRIAQVDADLFPSLHSSITSMAEETRKNS